MRYHDDVERRKWQDPGEILSRIGLSLGDWMVDVGCGTGFFALPGAKIVGPAGRVCGIDIDSESIDALSKEASGQGLDNIRLREGAAEEIVLCSGCADLVFFGIDLHDFENPQKVLRNARKMVKISGRLVDLDWKAIPMGIGPPAAIRFPEEKAAGLIREAGFSIESIADSGRYHYLIIARPV